MGKHVDILEWDRNYYFFHKISLLIMFWPPWHETRARVVSVCLSRRLLGVLHSLLRNKAASQSGVSPCRACQRGRTPRLRSRQRLHCCLCATRQQSAFTTVTIYISQWVVCGFGMCADGYWHVRIVVRASTACKQVWAVECMSVCLWILDNVCVFSVNCKHRS